ncbi:MAG TPA: folylpolyglutamate synthase/dihydrofolate synthase family protein [Longimicrobiales bacterium]|nr:folylpolyglutamate synthase/dihydrofolate synthase family protein [Longimicrobiales bacterium]
MSPLTYDALVAELFPRLTGGIRWGLERTQRLLASVGDPHRSFRTVHVGGTNGKGSVAAHVDAVLRHSGHRVGLYSSPHLCTFRERVRIDGAAIREAALLDAAERLWPAVRSEDPSFFEATTALAFLALAEAGVDVAVVEVGLGGRLDATNVIEPDVTVLTNVSLDHVQLLGPTIDAVAREKAGIIKAGVPVVTGEMEGDAAEIFRAAAQTAGAPLRGVAGSDVRDVATAVDGTEFTLDATGWGELHLRTPLAGRHQALNAALAVHALDVASGLRPDADAVVQGIARVRWPGRLQVERAGDVTWIFDVAHNVAGVEALVAAIGTLPFPRPVTALVGVLGDKDWRNMLAPLHEAVEHVVLTSPPTAPADRSWDPADALAAAPSAHAEIRMSFTEALERVHALALEGGGSVVVTGSFHTVGDALAALGLCMDGSDIVIQRPAFL